MSDLARRATAILSSPTSVSGSTGTVKTRAPVVDTLRRISRAGALASIVALSACSANGGIDLGPMGRISQSELTGAGIGAVGGGVAGRLIGGNLIGAAAGAIGGALVGGKLADLFSHGQSYAQQSLPEMDRQQFEGATRQAVQTALRTTGSGSVRWQGPGGDHGTARAHVLGRDMAGDLRIKLTQDWIAAGRQGQTESEFMLNPRTGQTRTVGQNRGRIFGEASPPPTDEVAAPRLG